MSNGKLIVFEGMDCCGKSTQLKLAKEYLINKGYKVYTTREPGGTLVGEKIRRILKDSSIPIAIETEKFLFATARQEHNVLINKLLNEDYIVLCDRHYLTSYVYQGIDTDMLNLNNAANRILIKNGHAINIITYDLTYGEYVSRINNRDSKDRFEKRLMNKKYFNTIRESYRINTNREKGHFVLNDNRNIRNIKKDTIKIIEDILKGDK